MLKSIDFVAYFKNNLGTLKSILTYLLLSAFLFNFYKYSVAQDLISYISIAQKYSAGDFNDAINGVWGPLISWLMIPFTCIDLNPIISFKFLQILIGAFTLKGVISLYEIFGFQKPLKYYLFFSTILIIEYYVFLTGTPDLLLACILIYLILVFLKVEQNSIQFSIYSGVLGALMYFTKPYGLPAFIVIYIGLNFLLWLYKNNNCKIYNLKYGIIGLLIFFFLITPWVYALSTKYESITFSTGGEYNFAIVGPKYNGIHVPRIEKLYNPINNSAISYWEDPSFLKVESWNPIGNQENFKHAFLLILKNIAKTLKQFIIFSPFLIIFIFILPPKVIFKERKIVVIALVLLIYVSGLLLLFVEGRFLIIARLILLVLTGRYFNLISDKYNITFFFQSIIALLLFISLSLQPVYSLVGYSNADKDIFIVSEKLYGSVKSGNNVASVSNQPLEEDWGSSLTLCYLSGLKYFGEVGHKLNKKLLYTELKRYDIKYFFVWDNILKLDDRNFSVVFRYKISKKRGLMKGEIMKELMIYEIK